MDIHYNCISNRNRGANLFAPFLVLGGPKPFIPGVLNGLKPVQNPCMSFKTNHLKLERQIDLPRPPRDSK